MTSDLLNKTATSDELVGQNVSGLWYERMRMEIEVDIIFLVIPGYPHLGKEETTRIVESPSHKGSWSTRRPDRNTRTKATESTGHVVTIARWLWKREVEDGRVLVTLPHEDGREHCTRMRSHAQRGRRERHRLILWICRNRSNLSPYPRYVAYNIARNWKYRHRLAEMTSR